MSTESNHSEAQPFKTVVPPRAESTLDSDVAEVDDELANDELELLYQQALAAVDAIVIDTEFPEPPCETTDDDDFKPDLTLISEDEPIESAADGEDAVRTEHAGVTARQIIEAALFVGGTPLTIKRIGHLLRNEFDQNFVERTIESLNGQYADEQRPYEIAFGEGGYRLALRADFGQLRSRVYGFGPKDVKLSQDALEVLALVAYRQPVSASEIEEAGKSKPGSLLRLLVRRQLIAIERDGAGRDDVSYCTTPRFLELFGLKDLEELPQSDDELEFR